MLLLTLYKFNKTPSIFLGIQDAVYKTMYKMGALKVMSASTALTIASMSPTILLGGLTLISGMIEDSLISIEEQSQKVLDLKDELETLKSEESTLEKKEDKTPEDDKKLELLQQEIALKEAILKIDQNTEYEKKYQGELTWLQKLGAELGYVGNTYKTIFTKGLGDDANLESDMNEIYKLENLGAGDEAIEKRIELIQKLEGENQSLSEELMNLKTNEVENKDAIDDNTDSYAKNQAEILKQNKALLEQKTYLESVVSTTEGNTEENRNLIASINDAMGATDALVQSTQTSAEVTADSQAINSSLTSVYDNLKSSMELVTQAQAEQDEQGYLSLDTVLKMIEAGTQYSDLLTFQNGQFQLQGDATNALWEIKKAEAINTLQLKKDEIQMQIAVQEAMISAYENEALAAKLSSQTGQQSAIAMGEVANTIIASLGGVSDAVISSVNKAVAEANKVAQLDGGSDKLRNQIVNLKKESANLDNLMTNISNMTLPQFTASVNGASKATDKAKDSTKGLEKEIDNLKDAIDGLKDTLSDAKDKLEETTTAYEAMQEAIENQLDKEIKALEKKLDLIDEQKERYEMMQNLAKKQLDDEMQALQDQIDALDEKKKEEDDILKLEEAQLAVRKAQEALDNAKKQKDTRVYEEGVGWSFQSNPKDVSDASSSLEEALKNLTELQKEFELAKKKADLQGQIDELKKLSDAWGENMEDVNNTVKDHEEVVDFLKKFESASLEERQKMLADFTIKYNENVIKTNKATQSEIDKLKDLKEQWSKSMDISADLSKYEGAVDWLKKFENASYNERKSMLSNFTRSWQNEYNTQNNSIIALENKIASLENKLKGMQKSLSDAKSNLSSAQDSLNRFNNTPVSNKTTTVNSDVWAPVRVGNVLYNVHYINNREVARVRIGNYTDVGSSNPSFVTGNGNIVSKYADGGVDSFGRSGVIDQTGLTNTTDGRTVQLDGTKSSPEVILNNEQASSVLYRLANKPIQENNHLNNNVNNQKSSKIVIQNLNVHANNNDTFERIIMQAEQYSKINN